MRGPPATLILSSWAPAISSWSSARRLANLRPVIAHTGLAVVPSPARKPQPGAVPSPAAFALTFSKQNNCLPFADLPLEVRDCLPSHRPVPSRGSPQGRRGEGSDSHPTLAVALTELLREAEAGQPECHLGSKCDDPLTGEERLTESVGFSLVNIALGK